VEVKEWGRFLRFRMRMEYGIWDMVCTTKQFRQDEHQAIHGVISIFNRYPFPCGSLRLQSVIEAIVYLRPSIKRQTNSTIIHSLFKTNSLTPSRSVLSNESIEQQSEAGRAAAVLKFKASSQAPKYLLALQPNFSRSKS